MRVWFLPLRVLDDRRLVAQHNEAHICLTVVTKFQRTGRHSGWSSSPSARPFIRKRGGLLDYHDNMLLPELARRGFNHHSPINPGFIPHDETAKFWDLVTWDMVLKDCRHLFEKWEREENYVAYAKANDIKTRVIAPRGHHPELLRSIFHLAISHVFGISKSDEQGLRVKGEELLSEQLLTGPFPKRSSHSRRRSARV